MPARTLSPQKIRNIITLNALCDTSHRELSRTFGASASTVAKYLSAFEHSSLSLAATRKLSDNKFLIALSLDESHRTPRREAVLKAFPAIHKALTQTTTTLLDEWRNYIRLHSDGYRYAQFVNLYTEWRSDAKLEKPLRNRWSLPNIGKEDQRTLKAWRSSNNKRKWQRAVALLYLHEGRPISEKCENLRGHPRPLNTGGLFF